MFNGRFYGSWLFSSGLMYLGFYLFHGVLTNDLLKLAIPKTLFLSVAAIVYLTIGFGMTVAFNSTTLKKSIKGAGKRGFLIGILTGLFMYAVAFTVGISFSYKVTMFNILIDTAWQLIEQNIGAFSIVLVYFLFYRPEEEVHVNFL